MENKKQNENKKLLENAAEQWLNLVLAQIQDKKFPVEPKMKIKKYA